MSENWHNLKNLEELQEWMDRRQKAFLEQKELQDEIAICNQVIELILTEANVKSTWGESQGQRWSVSWVEPSTSRVLDKKELLKYIGPDDLEKCYTEKEKKGFLTVREIKEKESEQVS